MRRLREFFKPKVSKGDSALFKESGCQIVLDDNNDDKVAIHPIPRDLFTLIIYQLWLALREENPALWSHILYSNRYKVSESWNNIRLVCKGFNLIAKNLQNHLDSPASVDKWVPYVGVVYSDNRLHLEPEKSQNSSYSFKSTEDIVAIRQLGIQPFQTEAPLLVCNAKFEYSLYELNPGLRGSAKEICRYDQHKARLTSGIFLAGTVISGDEKGNVGIWRPIVSEVAPKSKSKKKTAPPLNAPRNIRYFHAHTSSVSSIDYISDSEFVTAGDTTVKFWNVESSNPILVLEVGLPVVHVRARSINELVVITRDRMRALTVSYFLNGRFEPSFTYKPTNADTNLISSDEFSLATPTKIIGCSNQVLACAELDFKEKDSPKVTNLQPIQSKMMFFNSGNRLATLTKLMESYYQVSFYNDPASTRIMNLSRP